MTGLYVHIPFCLKKCKYCDFNSFAFSAADKGRYLNALFSEMEQYRGKKCDTVFIGGGTPTALNTAEMKMLLQKIKEIFILSKDCEFTVEANPKTVDRQKLEVVRQNGVNRLSLGVQSFNDSELLLLGRLHTAKEAEETVALAKDCGFTNISIDLMSAIPGQTADSFKKSLDTAFSQNPAHISCYSLILEEGTPLFREFHEGLLTLPDEDEERRIYELACSQMQLHGYEQYEISNFAKPGFESRHNIKYWKCEEYIGVGLSAHSYLNGVRFSNTDCFSDYLDRKYRSGENELLSEKDKMSEFMFLGLRMTKGVSAQDFYKKFGVDIKKVYGKPLSKFIKMGMIVEENGFLRLSHEAISVSNQIMCEFII
ncbi:MAG: oxygen-independent coproporphyrinogen III oxidase [Clostridia bacterium]|nr:oxygen-independent coproporphyrinogen III oxidase [Clostridia bacterium]